MFLLFVRVLMYTKTARSCFFIIVIISSYYCILYPFLIFAESFKTFKQLYPEWCESFLERCARANGDMTGFIGDADTLMGLRSLHITPSLVPHTRNVRRQHQLLSARSTSPESSGGSDIESLSDVDSSSSLLGFDEDRDFPVEILPDLFLGNAVNSEDLEWLKKHHIEVWFKIWLVIYFYLSITEKLEGRRISF